MSIEHPEELTATQERAQPAPSRGGLPLRWPTFGLAGRTPNLGQAIPEGRGTLASLRRDGRYRRLLGAADLISMVVASFTAITLLGRSDILRPAALLALPIVLVVGKSIGLYDRDQRPHRKTTRTRRRSSSSSPRLRVRRLAAGRAHRLAAELGKGQILVLLGSLFVFSLVGRALARTLLARRLARARRCSSATRASDRLAEQAPARRQDASYAAGVDARRARGDEDHDGDRSRGASASSSRGRRRSTASSSARAPGRRGRCSTRPRGEGARRARERAAADVRGRRLVGRVRRPRRHDAARRAPLRPHAAPRACSSAASTCVGSAFGLLAARAAAGRDRARDQARLARARCSSARRASAATARRSRCSSSARWSTDAEQLKARALRTATRREGLFKIADDPRITRVGRVPAPDARSTSCRSCSTCCAAR